MKLFVYGTLKRGYGNHRLMYGAEYLGNGFIKDFVVHDFGRCPGIRPSEGGVVHGELFEVPDDILPRLDRLEGHYPDNPERSLYRRTETRCYEHYHEGSDEVCSTYVYNRHTDAPICESGEWT